MESFQESFLVKVIFAKIKRDTVSIPAGHQCDWKMELMVEDEAPTKL